MTERERAARAIGFLEGFSATVWATADEFAERYDDSVEALRKALARVGDEEGDKAWECSTR